MKVPTLPLPAGTMIRLFLLLLTAVIGGACHTTAGLGHDIKHVGQKIESTAQRIH
jgi:predicted small secreted protein